MGGRRKNPYSNTYKNRPNVHTKKNMTTLSSCSPPFTSTPTPSTNSKDSFRVKMLGTFQDAYQRSNKNSDKKHLRCFPRCCTSHHPRPASRSRTPPQTPPSPSSYYSDCSSPPTSPSSSSTDPSSTTTTTTTSSSPSSSFHNSTGFCGDTIEAEITYTMRTSSVLEAGQKYDCSDELIILGEFTQAGQDETNSVSVGDYVAPSKMREKIEREDWFQSSLSNTEVRTARNSNTITTTNNNNHPSSAVGFGQCCCTRSSSTTTALVVALASTLPTKFLHHASICCCPHRQRTTRRPMRCHTPPPLGSTHVWSVGTTGGPVTDTPTKHVILSR